jgi:hypothetical protein
MLPPPEVQVIRAPLPYKQMETQPLDRTVHSALSRMHKGDYRLDGRGEKITLGEHIMWTIIPDPLAGLVPLRLVLQRRNEMREMQIRRWNVNDIRTEPSLKIEPVPIRLTYSSSNSKRLEMRQTLPR